MSVTADKVETWVPTQLPDADRSALDPWAEDRTVVVHPMLMGGSVGRKGTQTVAAEVARLSAAANRPVHVGWSRAEEVRHSFYRQPTHTVLRGKVEGRRIHAVEQVGASGNISYESPPGFVAGIVGVDISVLSGLRLPYVIPHYSIHTEYVPLDIPTGLWRGVGLVPNGFALGAPSTSWPPWARSTRSSSASTTHRTTPRAPR